MQYNYSYTCAIQISLNYSYTISTYPELTVYRPLPAPVISATFPAKLRRSAIILGEKFYPKATQLVGTML